MLLAQSVLPHQPLDFTLGRSPAILVELSLGESTNVEMIIDQDTPSWTPYNGPKLCSVKTVSQSAT